MTPKEDGNALHLISDILDRLIDAQQKNADTNAEVSVLLDETVESVKYIKSLFTNGFRSEIKEHISREIKKVEDIQKEINKNVQTTNSNIVKVHDLLSKPSFWVKLFGIMLGSIAAIVTGVWQLLNALGKP